MRVLIVGIGGVGGYIAGEMMRNSDAEVTLVARGEHLKAIKENGLHIIDNKKEYTLQPHKVVESPHNEGGFDLIIVTVKSYDLVDALKSLQHNINSTTTILPLLNGVDHDHTIKKLYPKAKVLKGCVYIISHILKPGTIIKKGEIFKLCWGDPNSSMQEYQEVASLFDAVKLRHKYTQNIDYEIWKKYLFIAAMAALTTYYKTSMDTIASEHSEEFKQLLNEIVTIAQKRGVALTQADIEASLTQASKVLPGAKTSMQLDFERGKESEIDSLLGYIVKSAHELRVNAELMEKIYTSLKSTSQI